MPGRWDDHLINQASEVPSIIFKFAVHLRRSEASKNRVVFVCLSDFSPFSSIIWTPLNYSLWQQQSLELVLVSANNNLYKNFAGFNMTKIFSYMRNANLFVHIFFFEFAFFLRRRTVINRNTN